MVVIPTTCDAKRKLGEELASFKDVWLLETPHYKDADFSRRIWMEQMYALKVKLETFKRNGTRGRRINARRMAAAIDETAGAQRQMRRLLALRTADRPPIWGRQATAVINAYGYAHVSRWREALARLNDRLTTAADADRPRIYIAGSPSIFPNLKIPTLVEEMGGLVVADESCVGDRYLYDPVGSTEKNMTDHRSTAGTSTHRRRRPQRRHRRRPRRSPYGRRPRAGIPPQLNGAVGAALIGMQ